MVGVPARRKTCATRRRGRSTVVIIDDGEIRDGMVPQIAMSQPAMSNKPAYDGGRVG
jgi:hypothetical protein